MSVTNLARIILIAVAGSMIVPVMAAAEPAAEALKNKNPKAEKMTISATPKPVDAQADEALKHKKRAVSESDFKAITQDAPGTDVDRVTATQAVKGGTKPESSIPAEKRVPETLRHRDRVNTKENDKKVSD